MRLAICSSYTLLPQNLRPCTSCCLACLACFGVCFGVCFGFARGTGGAARVGGFARLTRFGGARGAGPTCVGGAGASPIGKSRSTRFSCSLTSLELAQNIIVHMIMHRGAITSAATSRLILICGCTYLTISTALLNTSSDEHSVYNEILFDSSLKFMALFALVRYMICIIVAAISQAMMLNQVNW